MLPDWTSPCGRVRLICGDCKEWLPDLSVDHCITDPPYGAETHDGARTGGDGSIKLVHFDCLTTEEFLEATRLMVEAAQRWTVMTCEWRHAAKLEESKLPLIRLGVWIKPNGAPQFTGDRPATGWEAVAILHRDGKKRWNGGGLPAVWTCNKENTEHPTGKPVRLLNTWLRQFTDEGETVLDPFMGSGTTGIACLRTGRRFVGIEISTAYYQIAKARIEMELAQGTLPLSDTPRPRQEELLR